MESSTADLPRIEDLDLPVLGEFVPNDPGRFAMLDAARSKSWIARKGTGYSILRYEDVVAVHRDKRFINGGNVGLRRAGITDERFLARRPNPFLRAEGEDHARLRRLVAPAFSARGADKLRPFMRKELNDFADQVLARGHAELVSECFDMFPIAVICHLLGAPREDWRLFFDWTREIFQIYGGDIESNMERILEAHRELDDYTERLIESRRKTPGPDLLTELIAAEEAGDRLSTDELVSIVEAVLLAGTDTTRSQLGITVATVLQNPDQLAKLLADPALVAPAVEESLRYLATSGGQPRYAPEDTEFKGVLFPAGTLFETNFVSANFDPAIWGNDADTYEIERPKAGYGQLTFGIGRHVCLGASIARAELEETLLVLLQRLPGLRIAGDVAYKSSFGGGMWAVEHLPVAFDPA
jgi:cytochrome P450